VLKGTCGETQPLFKGMSKENKYLWYNHPHLVNRQDLTSPDLIDNVNIVTTKMIEYSRCSEQRRHSSRERFKLSPLVSFTGINTLRLEWPVLLFFMCWPPCVGVNCPFLCFILLINMIGLLSQCELKFFYVTSWICQSSWGSLPQDLLG
jgi:hypothetical protein